jgi:hypothetical protein
MSCLARHIIPSFQTRIVFCLHCFHDVLSCQPWQHSILIKRVPYPSRENRTVALPLTSVFVHH